jgi:cell wall-associated protease
MNKLFSILLVTLFISSFTLAQKKDEVPKGWHLMDKTTDGFNGVSADKAYSFLKSKNLKSKTVIVAVIDSGIDTLHEDLKPVLWTNAKEIANNGIDDDKNGYIDDVHGWNFLGGKDGRSVKEDSYEGARVYHKFKTKYEGKSSEDVAENDRIEFEMWQKAKAATVGSGAGADADMQLSFMKKALENTISSDSILKIAMGKVVYTGKELDEFKPTDAAVTKAKRVVLEFMKGNDQLDATNKDFIEGFNEYVNGEVKKADAKNNPPQAYRAEIVGDNEADVTDRKYGNNDIMANTPLHGTHCSGIIAAARNNGKGMDGIADNVRIMMLRAVPDGDEHDKDIANAIRYAVDNGAQIISMSFGKGFSPEKKWVDDAFKYAETKNVLLVKAAGNDAKNIDNGDNYPSTLFLDGKTRASNVITVGASGDPKTGGLTANFSNYGKKEVDVFSPGVRIYATLPGGDTYGNLQGTSMACPLVAGIAALTLEYFPNLTAKQLKSIIEKSAQAPAIKVKKPGTDDLVNLVDISKTGGIVNAYEAVKLASTIKGDKKIQQDVLPKPKMIKNKKG